MPCIEMSEMPDHPAFAQVKYKIGDTIRVDRIKATNANGQFEPETMTLFETCAGRRFKVKDVVAWAIDDDHHWLTYEIHVGHLNGHPKRHAGHETIYLDDDEIVPKRKRRLK